MLHCRLQQEVAGLGRRLEQAHAAANAAAQEAAHSHAQAQQELQQRVQQLMSELAGTQVRAMVTVREIL